MNNLPLAWTKGLARRAGAMMRAAKERDVQLKDDKTVVTATDRAINAMVIAEVAKAFPDHGVLGEEASDHQDREWLWVCDPIDGTLAFIAHVPVSTFSIALVQHGEPKLAVTYNPWTDQLYWATKGGGAFCNDQPLRVSTRSQPPLFIGATGSTTARDGLLNSVKGVAAMRAKGWTAINFFGCVQKGNMVAEGSIDGYVYDYRGAHDIAAVQLLVTEAGGRVTDLSGHDQPYNQPINGAIVSNGLIHNQLLQLVAQLRLPVDR